MQSVPIQVRAKVELRIACVADVANIRRLDAYLFEAPFFFSLDKHEVYVLQQNEVFVGYLVYRKKMEFFGSAVWGCYPPFDGKVSPDRCCNMFYK